MTDALANLAAEGIKLALAAGVVSWSGAVLLVVGFAVLIWAAKAIGRVPLPPPEEPAPAAVWNTDPAAGAVVVPNDEPGGPNALGG